MPAQEPRSVLFACTRNSIRSPMAEAMLKAMRGRAIYVDSVGLINGQLDPFAVEVMREVDIDLSRHNPKRFEDRWDTSFDLLICLSPEAYEHGKALARTAAMDVEFWDIEDPTETTGNRTVKLDAYRRVRDSLMHKLQQHFGPGDAA